MKMMNRKGQTFDLQNVLIGGASFAVAFLVLFVVLFAMGTTVETVRNQNLFQATNNISTNETHVLQDNGVGGFNGSFLTDNVRDGVVSSSTVVTNETATYVLNTDYTVNAGTGNITVFLSSNTSGINITYDFLTDIEDAPVNISQNGLIGLINFSAQGGNIGTIAAIIMVILILVAGFGFVLRDRIQ